MKRLCLVLLALVCAACGSQAPLPAGMAPLARSELADTPFFPQEAYQCGPAALATVLVASGVEITAERLAPHVYLPGRRGSLQVEMLAATRAHGRVPYLLQPDLAELLTEVAAGSPVLVMQNLGLRRLPRWHYAVVIGYDPLKDSVLLRSGTTERLGMNRRRFESNWLRADRWAMVAAAPATPPPTARSTDWLRAGSVFEALGQAGLAAEMHGAATVRWPEEPLAWQALAHARYLLDDATGAETALGEALRLHESAAAHNNMAHLLLARGCRTAASRHITLAESIDTGVLADVLANTRAAVEANGPAAHGPDSPACPRDVVGTTPRTGR